MRSGGRYSRGRLVEYDRLSRRVWILGQRCHHGATGSVLAALACVALIVERAPEHPKAALALAAAAGGVLMIHDWKDHSEWFERGHGSRR